MDDGSGNTLTEPIDLDARLDDEHRDALAAFPSDGFDPDDLPKMRGAFDAVSAPPVPEDVLVEDHSVPGLDGAPPVVVRSYRGAVAPAAGAPALLWIHGGGMILGKLGMNDFMCARWARRHDAVVVSVDYRLAPEHPFPAALDDCGAALRWLASDDGPGVDPERLVVGGASAGGGLAAGLSLRVRDRGGPRIRAQLLVYPMLDHRNVTRSSHAVVDPRVWNRRANEFAWAAYLGQTGGDGAGGGASSGGAGIDGTGGDGAAGIDGTGGDVSPYASPAIAGDLTGLPPAYVCVGDLDLFLDEDVAYAQALAAAHVPVELHVYPGAFHGSDGLVPASALSRRWRADIDAMLARTLGS